MSSNSDTVHSDTVQFLTAARNVANELAQIQALG
jgi:hypothetical protein